MKTYDDLSDPILQEAVVSIQTISLSDTTNEGPHAWFAHETTHASGAKFAWKSATARLSQNLVDYEVLPPVVQEFDPQTAFDNFKSVLQTRARRRDARCSRKK